MWCKHPLSYSNHIADDDEGAELQLYYASLSLSPSLTIVYR